MKEESKKILKNYKQEINEAVNDLKTPGKRHKQIPNILTFLRLLSPFFIIPAAITGNVPLVLGMTAGFALTDFADGYIARKYHLTSKLGKDLDAITDKVFAATLLSAAAVSNPLLLCNLGLEGIIAGINVCDKLNGVKTESTLTGKIKTWFLFSLASVGIVAPYLNATSFLPALSLATVLMQVATIKSYLPKNKKEVLTAEPESIDESFPIITESNEEGSMFTDEKVLTHDSTAPVMTATGQQLEGLKEMSAFLHGCQQAGKEPTEETKKTFIKNRTETSNN